MLGGAQSIHTNSYDEALALPTEESALLALRTQQVIAHESGLADVVDPLGGSYALEALTNELEARAASLIAEVDARGGMVAAIEAGFPQREIERRAFEHQRAVATGARVIVGVNRFGDEAAADPALHRLDPALEAAQVERLASAPRATRPPRAPPRARSPTPRGARRTSCLASCRPSRPTRRSARSRTRSATSSGNTGRPSRSSAVAALTDRVSVAF